MRLAMVFIDLFWFVFVTLTKVGGLTGAIIYFAEFTDQKASTGLMPLRAYTNAMWGYNIEKRVEKDREKLIEDSSNIENEQKSENHI